MKAVKPPSQKKSNPYKNKRTPNKPVHPAPTKKSSEQSHRRLWLAARATFGILMSLAGIALGVYAFEGPPWPTEPTFVPGSPSFGSPFSVPFTITNKSAVVDLNRLEIRCGIATKIQGEPPAGGTLQQGEPGHPAFVSVTGPHSQLEATETRSYTCAFAQLSIYVGPNPKITFAEMTFESEYDSWLPWGGRKIVRSPIFELDTSTVPPQWKPASLK